MNISDLKQILDRALQGGISPNTPVAVLSCDIHHTVSNALKIKELAKIGLVSAPYVQMPISPTIKGNILLLSFSGVVVDENIEIIKDDFYRDYYEDKVLKQINLDAITDVFKLK
ncbi:hypothetical protein ACP179_01970 (plasmid) [Xenorhabdus stockiae]|uniref:hypothetical protein n=1 Tax=Xenorhabdus stockiae TaxID=351614 RepID=UPI003CEA831D